MRHWIGCGLVLLLNACATVAPVEAPRPGDPATMSGFVSLRWQGDTGRLLIAVRETDVPFLYQSSLARGLGSNDIGLDRGQLGATHIVRFVRSGPKILLLADNPAYRATSANPFEREAIEASFARSVLFGFTVVEERDGTAWIDGTDFFLRDAHGVSTRLAAQGHGSFAVDPSRSAIYLPRTKSFVDNTEIEARVTFTGQPAGDVLHTVVPDPRTITLHLHHSFVRLPGPGYEPLPYDPRSGFIDADFLGGFFDFAAPIDRPLAQAFARRHRLHKADPTAAISVPREPIVYYVDRGAPEPVRSALIEGASWWNEAFEAAGYRDAFQVRLLPEDADPMDVRYNVIQWVHRSTRGWSYGASVADPRTGEIIKGHVTLGSLRVRQDYLLAEGLLSPYRDDAENAQMREFSLARIRQLSAHEVGHTLGLEHNFAGSAYGRASVMDYPYPLLSVTPGGDIDVSQAYATGIGSWDTRAIVWGYSDLSGEADPAAARERILAATAAAGHRFVADRHARSIGALHPDGSLWDNGADPIEELATLRRVRRIALARLGEATVRPGRPLATIEEALVTTYLLHRYQIEAVGKLIGGARFDYPLRGDGRANLDPVADERQRAALDALLDTLTPGELGLPPSLASLLGTRPPGFAPTRELFARHTGDRFDDYAPARAFAQLCMAVLFEPTRAARLEQAHASDAQRLGLRDLLGTVLARTWYGTRPAGRDGAYRRVVDEQALQALLGLANHESASAPVRAAAWGALVQLRQRLAAGLASARDAAWRDHDRFAIARIDALLEDPAARKPVLGLPTPPGSPIG